MKISVGNLGVLKKAEFELGDLTIICGDNNTGKTYAAYSLYCFLSNWLHLMKIDFPNSQISTLISKGSLSIDITSWVEKTNMILKRTCQNYTKSLPSFLASKPSNFKDSSFQILLQPTDLSWITEQYFKRNFKFSNNVTLSMIKAKDDTDIIVTLVLEGENPEILYPSRIFKDLITEAIGTIIFGQIFPKPFIASAERTGATIFHKELNFSRNRLLEEMIKSDKNVDPMELLFSSYQDYPQPVRDNTDFIRNLESVVKRDSFIAENHPEILNDFSQIVGGQYQAVNDDMIYFKPHKNKSIRLAMDESSSAARSLLDIGFYLRHQAKKGDILMVDEPELNLHPENQRRIARIFARLVNLDIKVFITTHSDYIIKELNTLIMLNQDNSYLKMVAEREGYKSEELISSDRIRVYMAEKALIKLKNNTKRSNVQTLVEAVINPELGIEARCFDETINKMNDIQDAILWGDED